MIRCIWVFSLLSAAFVLIALLGGCGSSPVRVTNDTLCKIDRPVTWSKADTKATIDGNRRHNARYHRSCG
jgi:hypothetical protein